MSETIKDFIKRIKTLENNLETEEATKTALIMPFFSLLGYDVFNPQEFIPEFTCDVGTKKGEKVDYAIALDGKIEMLIEAKNIGYNLDKVDSQLIGYFHVSDARIAIMTDGIKYRFYSDLDKDNIMDDKPFFEFNLLDLTDQQITDLEKFKKETYDVDSVLALAENLKNITAVQEKIAQEFSDPSDEFVKLIIADIHHGQKNKKVIAEYRDVITQAYDQFITESITKTLNEALHGIDSKAKEKREEIIEEPSKIVTTEEEIQFYQIIRSLLVGKVELERITYRDTESYFGILLDDNRNKWICRVSFVKDGLKIQFNSDKPDVKIEKLDDTFNYKKEIQESLDKVLSK